MIGIGNGTRVVANWGAGIPEDRGEIVDHDAAKGFLIRWDEESPGVYSYHDVREERPTGGSLIGVYVDERHAAQ